MSDKKNEDFVVNMPAQSSVEKEPFLARPPVSSRARSSGGAMGGGFSLSKIDNSPGASILAYCLSSISMTVVNKYVVSGSSWNLNFFYLAVQVRRMPPPAHNSLEAWLTESSQAIVCIAAILVCKQAGLITNLAPYDQTKAKRCAWP